ncbi:MAG TPA: shikimate kinase, partial [Casimicrobiaceae bacterium]|nr:shikimate kinase [Casimicrobiaceae bacterium]
MGVSGSGKSTVGVALASRLRWPFIDADDLHPAANVDKMRAGIPL